MKPITIDKPTVAPPGRTGGRGMIRQPSTPEHLYAWHTEALTAGAAPHHDGLPQCGWFKRRLVKGGPWVPVRIYVVREIDRDTGELVAPEEFRIEIEGVEAGEDPAAHWSYLTPISRAEFDHLMDYRLRDSRMMDTKRRIDLSAAPTRPQGGRT